MIFVHLNQKQDSREGISMYRQKEKTQKLIDEFSELTSALLQTQNIDEFSYLMEIHEKKLSQFLNIPTAKEKYFSQFVGKWYSHHGFFFLYCYGLLLFLSLENQSHYGQSA